jgi:Ca2+-binding RTX toxin-like protein
MIYGTFWDDVLTGDAGDNEFQWSMGNDTLDGGGGSDTINYHHDFDYGDMSDWWRPGFLDVNLATGWLHTQFIGRNNEIGGGNFFVRLISIENAVGSDDSDSFTGNGADNRLYGMGRDDTFYGSAGNDLLDGGDGNDTANYSTSGLAGGIIADLSTGYVSKYLVAGRYVRIYHNDSYVEGPQGHELGLTGIKVYDAAGRELAFGLRSSIGADGNANGAANPNNSNTALTDGIVGGGWNGQAGDAGTVAYANTGFGGAKAYIQLDLVSAQAIDSISLWGDAGYAIDSRNLRVYVSNTPFNASTTYASLAATQNVVRFDLAGAEISAAMSYIDPNAGISTGAGVDTLVGIENLTGTATNDRLRGDANANVLSGDAGNDTLVGSESNDRLDGGTGVDTASYDDGPMASSVIANLGKGIAYKIFAGTNVSMAMTGKTGRYIRVYHNDNYVEGTQGHELGLTGMKVYDTLGRDVAFGLLSSIGADGSANGAANPNNSTVALTDAIVGGGWNGLAGDAGTVAYANTGVNGAKAYIQLDLGAAQAIDTISLWGDAGWSIDSKNLRVYVSNTTFYGSTTYASLAADQNVARVDLAGVETSATTAYTDTLINIENLAGSAINDTLTGDANANVLSGGAGNDALWGGAGNDTLDGGAGIDTYSVGFMADSVNTDLSQGIATKVLAGSNVSIPATTGRYIRIYHNDSYVEGPQGHELGLTGMKVYDAGGNDLAFGLRSSIGTDGNANDLLAGGAGSDTYKFQRGDGVDTIVDMDYMAGYSPDLLQFQGDISSGQLWFRQAGYDLEVSVIGTADKTVVQDWYTGTASHVEQIKAGDGKLLLDAQVQNLVQAMAAFAPPAMGQTTLTAAQQTALAPVLAANWH